MQKTIDFNSQVPTPGTVHEVQVVYRRPGLKTITRVTSSKEADQLFRSFYPMGQIDYKEFFYAAFLNTAKHVLGVSRLSEGGLTGTIVDQRQIFQMALKLNACAFIVSHNHPSGSLKPSGADIGLTQKLKESGHILNIELLDHLILTSEGYCSFADDELL